MLALRTTAILAVALVAFPSADCGGSWLTPSEGAADPAEPGQDDALTGDSGAMELPGPDLDGKADDVDADQATGPCVGPGTCIELKFHTCSEDGQAVVLDCASSTPCLVAGCEDGVGCSLVPDDAAACEDGDACTVDDLCSNGVCLAGEAQTCADGNECTEDLCNPAIGCVFAPLTGPRCDDGVDCTLIDRCVLGACVPSFDQCDCFEDADCLVYDDGNPCTGLLVCADGMCQTDPATVPDCSPLPVGQCEVAACDPDSFTCVPAPRPDGESCDDDNACTLVDACAAGVCVGTSVLDCDDGNSCTANSCQPAAGCVEEPLAGWCDDGDPCTVGDTCQDGACASGDETYQCVDGNPCTTGQCISGQGCVFVVNQAECNDGDPCTVDDVCASGLCAGTPMCGDACLPCEAWQSCVDGSCTNVYAPPPYGPFEGDFPPDQSYLEHVTLDIRKLSEFYQQGKLLLITFTSIWCIVCEADTVLLNAWHAQWAADGLHVVEVLYEDLYEQPITQPWAVYWAQTYGIQYELWMDTPVLGPDGEAAEGNLAFYREPSGPLGAQSFPGVILICTETMEILYIKTGFYEEEVEPLIQQYLAEPCAGPN